MTRKQVAVAIIAGVAVIALILVIAASGVIGAPEPIASPGSEPATRPATDDRRAAPREHEDPQAATPRSSPEPEPESKSEPENQLRRSLQQKFGRSSAPRAGEQEPPVEPPPSWSSLPESYVVGIVREQLIPVAQSCYEDLLTDDLGGEMSLSVSVIGDAEVGGVVDRVDITDADASVQGDLTECVRQAAYDMEFDPPEHGQGVGEFSLSIRFSQLDDPK